MPLERVVTDAPSAASSALLATGLDAFSGEAVGHAEHRQVPLLLDSGFRADSIHVTEWTCFGSSALQWSAGWHRC